MELGTRHDQGIGLPTCIRLPVRQAAPLLLGCVLVRQFGDGVARVRIVETEAYDQDDAASHSYKGHTPRTSVMFGPAGRLYVYFTYGMHYCANVVVGAEGRGEGVLIRAVEPLSGREELERNRPATGIRLTNGPAKLCQALGINREMNGHDLREKPVQLIPGLPYPHERIVTTTRIGISQAADEPLRFYLEGNPYVSRA